MLDVRGGTHYVYERPHKDRSARRCVVVSSGKAFCRLFEGWLTSVKLSSEWWCTRTHARSLAPLCWATSQYDKKLIWVFWGRFPAFFKILVGSHCQVPSAFQRGSSADGEEPPKVSWNSFLKSSLLSLEPVNIASTSEHHIWTAPCYTFTKALVYKSYKLLAVFVLLKRFCTYVVNQERKTKETGQFKDSGLRTWL